MDRRAAKKLIKREIRQSGRRVIDYYVTEIDRAALLLKAAHQVGG